MKIPKGQCNNTCDLICNVCKWRHQVDKVATNASGASDPGFWRHISTDEMKTAEEITRDDNWSPADLSALQPSYVTHATKYGTFGAKLAKVHRCVGTIWRGGQNGTKFCQTRPPLQIENFVIRKTIFVWKRSQNVGSKIIFVADAADIVCGEKFHVEQFCSTWQCCLSCGSKIHMTINVTPHDKIASSGPILSCQAMRSCSTFEIWINSHSKISWFALFWRNICFVAIYTLLCEVKMNSTFLSVERKWQMWCTCLKGTHNGPEWSKFIQKWIL